MENLIIAAIAGVLILLASAVSVEFGLSVAICEIIAGVVAGNFLGLHTTPWIDFLAGFASIFLTVLAGTEVDAGLLREKSRGSLLLRGLSFAAPFLTCMAFTHWVPRSLRPMSGIGRRGGQLQSSSGAGYADYKKRTWAFIPFLR